MKKYPHSVIEGHYHIELFRNERGEDMYQTTRAYLDCRGFRSLNVCALPCLHEAPYTGVEANLLAALCKLRLPQIYIHGGLFYPQFPLTAPMPEGTDFLTQYRALMEIGFDGIKLLEGKPTEAKPIGKPISDPLYDPFFAQAEADGTHFVWHVADPHIFWDPEKAPDYCHAWGWYYGDGSYPSIETIYRSVMAVLERHPRLKVTFAHFFFLSDDMPQLLEILDRFPNVNIDLTPNMSMYRAFGKDPAYFREFFTRYADRVLYGTDACDVNTQADNEILADTVYEFLTAPTDRAFSVKGYNYRGMGLEGDVLHKILCQNFLDRVGQTPRPINVDALRAYWSKYRCYAQSKEIAAQVDAELEKI